MSRPASAILGRLGRNGPATVRPVIGHCRLCPDPIRTGDTVVWIRRPLMGRAHPACIAAALAAGTEVTVAAQ